MHSEVNVSQSNYPLKHWLGIAWRLFVREFGRGELTIIFLSIVLAVSSVMALSSVTDRVEKAIMSKSAAFIAADRDLRSAHPIEDEITQYAQELGLETDKHVYFNSMAFAGDEMNIAVIKAVTETYPLKGKLFITKSLDQTKIEVHGQPLGEVWMSKRLFYALSLSEEKLASGEPLTIEIGEGFFNVTGIITDEPDAPFEVFNSGTRIIMNINDVEKTNVIQPGSRISYRDLFAGEEDKLNEFTTWLEPKLKPNQRIRDVKEGCANIIWKSTEFAPDAAEAMGLTSTVLEELGIVDATIPEPQGGAHRDIDASAERVKEHILKHLESLQALPEPELLDIRYQRLMSYGTV